MLQRILERIERLVESLASLHGAERALLELIVRGDAADPALWAGSRTGSGSAHTMCLLTSQCESRRSLLSVEQLSWRVSGFALKTQLLVMVGKAPASILCFGECRNRRPSTFGSHQGG
jgi:hypothetical protein